MEIDSIFPSRIFSSKISTRAKILAEWKTALILLQLRRCSKQYLEFIRRAIRPALLMSMQITKLQIVF